MPGRRRRGPLPAGRPADAGGRARRDRRAGGPHAARRRRPGDDPALVGDHVRPEGHLALEQHAALRDGGDLPPLASDRRRRLPRRQRVRVRRGARLRLLPAVVQRRHGGPAQPLGRRRGAPAGRGAPLHLLPRDAHALGRPGAGGAGDDARPVVGARAGRPGPDARAPRRDEGGVRGPAARRLWPVGGARPRRARPRRARREDLHDRGPPVRRHRDPHRGRARAAGSGRGGRLGRGQRPQPVPGLLPQRRADAGVVRGLGRLPDR